MTINERFKQIHSVPTKSEFKEIIIEVTLKLTNAIFDPTKDFSNSLMDYFAKHHEMVAIDESWTQETEGGNLYVGVHTSKGTYYMDIKDGKVYMAI